MWVCSSDSRDRYPVNGDVRRVFVITGVVVSNFSGSTITAASEVLIFASTSQIASFLSRSYYRKYCDRLAPLSRSFRPELMAQANILSLP